MNLDAEMNRQSLNPLPDEWAARLLPTRPDSKAMCHKDGLVRRYTRAELAYWCGRGYGLGMKVGAGVMCVDIDEAGFRGEAGERYGLDSNLVVRTMRGVHLWARTLLTDQKTVLRWRELPVDFKFTGYMMWPPTVVNGFRYTLESGLPAIADLPEFPAGLLAGEKKPAPERTRGAGPPAALLPANADRYAAAALRYELQHVAAAKEGTRNGTLNRAAFCLGGLVAAGLLPREAVEAALAEAALAAGLSEGETAATIRSGMEAGMKHPRGKR